MTLWELMEMAVRSERAFLPGKEKCPVCGRLFEDHATDELDHCEVIYEEAN